MTFSELEEKVKKYRRRRKISRIFECNLFDEEIVPGCYPRGQEFGLYVAKRNNTWEVYWCERGSTHLECIFYSESDLYDYFFCFYKTSAEFI